MQRIYQKQFLQKDFVYNFFQKGLQNQNEFSKSSFKSVLLKKGFLKSKFDCERLTFEIRNGFKNNFKTSFVIQTKGEQRFVSKINCVFKIISKSLDLKSFKKGGVFCFIKQRPSKHFAFKTCIDFNPFQKSDLSWI